MTDNRNRGTEAGMTSGFKDTAEAYGQSPDVPRRLTTSNETARSARVKGAPISVVLEANNEARGCRLPLRLEEPRQPAPLVARLDTPTPAAAPAPLRLIYVGGPYDGETATKPPCSEITFGFHAAGESVLHRYTRTTQIFRRRVVFAYAGVRRISADPVGIDSVLLFLGLRRPVETKVG